jgi:hypothetical protein
VFSDAILLYYHTKKHRRSATKRSLGESACAIITRKNTVRGIMQHWLMKSEPAAFSFDDLTPERENRSLDGVRIIRPGISCGRCGEEYQVLFYFIPTANSLRWWASPKWCGRRIRLYRRDPEIGAFRLRLRPPDAPRWFMVDVRWKQSFARAVTLTR